MRPRPRQLPHAPSPLHGLPLAGLSPPTASYSKEQVPCLLPLPSLLNTAPIYGDLSPLCLPSICRTVVTFTTGQAHGYFWLQQLHSSNHRGCAPPSPHMDACSKAVYVLLRPRFRPHVYLCNPDMDHGPYTYNVSIILRRKRSSLDAFSTLSCSMAAVKNNGTLALHAYPS